MRLRERRTQRAIFDRCLKRLPLDREYRAQLHVMIASLEQRLQYCALRILEESLESLVVLLVLLVSSNLGGHLLRLRGELSNQRIGSEQVDR